MIVGTVCGLIGLMFGVTLTSALVMSRRDYELEYYQKQCNHLTECNDDLVRTLNEYRKRADEDDGR